MVKALKIAKEIVEQERVTAAMRLLESVNAGLAEMSEPDRQQFFDLLHYDPNTGRRRHAKHHPRQYYQQFWEMWNQLEPNYKINKLEIHGSLRAARVAWIRGRF